MGGRAMLIRGRAGKPRQRLIELSSNCSQCRRDFAFNFHNERGKRTCLRTNVENPTRRGDEKEGRTQNQTRPDSRWSCLELRGTPSPCRSWRPVAAHLFCGRRGERHAKRLLEEGLAHFLASLESILGIFGEGFPNGGIDPAGNRRVNERWRNGILIHDLVEDSRDIASKGPFAGQQFIEDST